jgi:hypothetical protein
MHPALWPRARQLDHHVLDQQVGEVLAKATRKRDAVGRVPGH